MRASMRLRDEELNLAVPVEPAQGSDQPPLPFESST